MTPGKTIALTIRTFVSKVMSLLCSILSTFVIGFLPRSKYLLILWLHSQTIIEEKLPNALEGKLQIDFPSSSTQWSPFDTKIGQVPVVLSIHTDSLVYYPAEPSLNSLPSRMYIHLEHVNPSSIFHIILILLLSIYLNRINHLLVSVLITMSHSPIGRYCDHLVHA